MSAPSVSVIIPSYNTARFITETLDSVFAQTFTDYEVIVVNDGSPDTPQLEIVLKPYFDRIVYLKQENRGLAGARNTGIRRARGAFLAFLDSDDMWLPEFLAEQVQIFHKNPAVDLVYSDTFQFRKMLGMGTLVVRPLQFDKPLTFETLLKAECSIIVSCTVVRKVPVIEAGLFDERLRRVEDYDLWLRIAFRGAKMAHHQKALGLRRLHNESLSADQKEMYEAWIGVMKKLAETLELSIQARMLVAETIRKAEAEMELFQGNRHLLDSRPELAEISLGRAYEFLRGRKLQLTLLGLRIAPWLVAPIVKGWRHILAISEITRAIAGGRLHWNWKHRQLYKARLRSEP